MEANLYDAFFPLLSVLGYGAALTCITKKDPGINLFASIGLVILAMYPLGFIEGFQHSWIVLAFGVALLPVACWELARKGYARLALLPEVVVPLLFVLGYWLLNHDARIHYTSEAQYWGKASKALFFFNSYVTNDVPVGWKEYFPGAALFHRFCLSLMPMKDGTLYFGHAVMYGMIAAPLFTRMRWRNWGAVALLSGTIFLAVQGLGRGGLFVLYVDALLGLGFASLLVFVYRVRVVGAQVAALVLAASAMTMIKSPGLLLVIFVLLFAVIAWRRELFARSDLRKGLVLALALTVAVPLALNTSWKVRNEVYAINKKLPFQMPTERIGALLSGSPQDLDRRIVKAFFMALSSYPINNISHPDRAIYKAIEAAGVQPNYSHIPKLHVVGWIACISAVFLMALAMRRERRKDILAAWGFLTATCLFYLASILYLELFVFTPFEGLNVMSMPRYAGVFLMGYFLFPVCLVLGPAPGTPGGGAVAPESDAKAARRGKRIVAAFGVLLASLWVWDTPGYYFLYPSRDWADEARAFHEAHDIVAQEGIDLERNRLLFFTLYKVEGNWNYTSYEFFPLPVEEVVPPVEICDGSEKAALARERLMNAMQRADYALTIESETECFREVFAANLPSGGKGAMLFRVRHDGSAQDAGFALDPVR